MIKGLHYIVLIASILSVSLLEGRNIGLTREIENLREGVICAVEKPAKDAVEEETEEENITIGYTDSFWVEEDETVYFLGTYSCEVLEYRRGEFRKIPLSKAILPSDIVSHDDKLYVYDDILSELQVYTKQGDFLLQSKVTPENDYVKELVKTENGVAVLTYGNQLIFMDSATGEQRQEAYTGCFSVDAEEYDYAEYIATDDTDVVYAVYTKLVQNCAVIDGEMTLRAVSAEGECLGSYILPKEEYTYLPNRYVQVHENGNIYLLVPTEQSVEVRKISLKDSVESKLAEISEQANALVQEYAEEYESNNDAPALTREEVWQRAQDMANYVWTLKPANTLYWYWDKNVELPREIEAIRKEHQAESSWSAEITGLPYCWGGYHCLDWGDKARTFQQALDAKFIAGNINTSGYYKYWSAGVDCSGYVGDALGFTSKLSTKGLTRLGSARTSIEELQQMDILVYPGDHVIFFCDRLDDATLLVSEAAIREGKVVIHPRSINEFVVNAKYQMRSPW